VAAVLPCPVDPDADGTLPYMPPQPALWQPLIMTRVAGGAAAPMASPHQRPPARQHLSYLFCTVGPTDLPSSATSLHS